MYDESSSIISYLLDIADRHDIKCFWPTALSPNTPPTALPSNNCIVMNDNWHDKKAIPFQLAHEMAHILKNDNSNWIRYYQGTYRGENKLEYETNRIAIKLLLSYFDTDTICYNPIRFMQAFAIPSHLESIVNEELNSFCSKNNDIDYNSFY